MYTVDNTSWTPPAYGMWGQSGIGRHLLDGDANKGMGKVMMQWFLGPSCKSLNNYLDLEDHDDNTYAGCQYPDAPGGAIATGLGLLYAGGYLTQKGVPVLNWPSLTNGADEGPAWPFTDASYTADAYRGLWNHINTPKLDSVFFTTEGKILWADRTPSFGFNDTCYMFGDWSWWAPDQMNWGNPPQGKMYPYGANWGLWDCGYNNGNPQPCTMIGNYMIRPDPDKALTYNSYKLDRMTGKALLSDAIWGWMWSTYQRSGWQLIRWNTPEMLTTRHWRSNHDMGYNVLMGDGSVKTFSDAGAALMKDIRMEQIRLNGATPSINWYGKRWEVYFDPLYAQD